MIELWPDIHYLPGKNRSRFPYCACLYVIGRDMRVLIDAGMGASVLEPVKKQGIDVLILTHCHIDHRLTRREIPDIPVWSHHLEAQYLSDRSRFYAGIGLDRNPAAVKPFFDRIEGAFDVEVSRKLDDNEKIDLGGLTLEVVHTPGHTPGHLSFYIPERKLLFTGDIDLSAFGPYYGHDFADIDSFIGSIDRLRRMDADIVASGHAGPFRDKLKDRFDRYENVIYQRDEKILAFVDRPMTVDDFFGQNLIYPRYPDDGGLIQWFERVHVEKHLARLERLGKIQSQQGVWEPIDRNNRSAGGSRA